MAAPALERTTVVVTDDDESLRQLLGIVLARAGDFEVVAECSDADSCLEAVLAHQPDVLLLDLGLPGRTGLEALPELRRSSPGSVLFVLSAHPAERMAARALDQGADAYLDKDELVSGLVPALRDALRARREAVPTSRAEPAEAVDLERFAATAAHDLRRQLLGVGAYADLLVGTDAVRQDSSALELVRELRASARCGLTLIDDLQAYADALARPDLRESVDLTDLAQQVVRTLLTKPRQVEVDLADLGTATGDPMLLRHVFVHLLDNAMTYRTEGRPVTVQVRRVELDGGVALQVDDDGVGVPEADRARVLRDFERGRATTATPGTGLGLSICRLVAARYGGSVVLGSSPQGGTRVQVTLPQALR